nr:MAG TPA: HNH endonuclease bacteriophage, HNH Endonuclease, DNA.52A [Caudoviricetes sp.]
MAKEFAKAFYNSAAWKRTAKAYAASKFFLCEKCGKQGNIVHHKVHLTPDNINDSDIALSFDNFMYLCTECHNVIHGKEQSRKSVFDENGNLIGITPPYRE